MNNIIPGPGANRQQGKINVQVSECNVNSCPLCGGTLFIPIFQIRVASRIQTGNAKDQIIPVQLWNCINCGKTTIPENLLPKQLKDKDKKEYSGEEYIVI